MPHRRPAGIAHLSSSVEGAAWLERLDDAIDAATVRWGLDVGEPFEGSHVSWTAPARLRGGHPVVVKVPFPHDECRWEAEALRRWDGIGAVRLLDSDPESGDLLLERAQPGTLLRHAGADEATEVMCGLVAALSIPAASPFGNVFDDAGRWLRDLPGRWERAGRPYEQRLLDLTLERLAAELPRARREPTVLVHQDLHGDNVVASERGWLAIDPKPLLGPQEFAVAPIVRSNELGHSPEAVEQRLRRLVEHLDLDADAARTWTCAQTLAWSTDSSTHFGRHFETVRWLLARA